MRARGTDRGFTILELMVVVFILTILMAIAIPVAMGVRARAARSACFSNERTVEGAWSRYRGTTEATAGVSDWDELMTVVVPSELKAEPTCPSDGDYSISGPQIVCTVHGTYHGP